MSGAEILRLTAQLNLEVHLLADEIQRLKYEAELKNDDARRYGYILNCEYLAVKKIIPLLDEETYKSVLRCKIDKEMGS